MVEDEWWLPIKSQPMVHQSKRNNAANNRRCSDALTAVGTGMLDRNGRIPYRKREKQRSKVLVINTWSHTDYILSKLFYITSEIKIQLIN